MPKYPRPIRFRPSRDTYSYNGVEFDLRNIVVAQWGFEDAVDAGGIVRDLSSNSHDATLENSAFVKVSDFPGALNRGSLDLRSNDTSAFVFSDGMLVNGSDSFSVNKAFSLSFWLKLDVLSIIHQLIFASSYNLTDTDFYCNISTSNVLNFRFSNGVISSFYRQIAADLTGLISTNTWFHVTITHDGTTLPTTSSTKIFVNGSPASTTASTTAGFISTVNNNRDIFFGGTRTSSNTDDLRGLFGSIEWWSRDLTVSEVGVIYGAQVNPRSFVTSAESGFISRSARLMIRELDDHPGSYPTVRRTGDTSRAGTLSTNFDDRSTMVFSDAGNPVFPSMLPRGSSFNSQAVDIVGGESDITITAPIRSFQHPNHLHYSPVEEMGPFNENRSMPATDFFLNGTDPDILPGFTSPVRSKIAIEIDITPQSDTRVMRNVDRRTVAEGGASIGDKTGFLYYNFDRSEWEQIGLNDPATGDSIYYDYSIDCGDISGSFPMQFMTTPGFPGSSLQQRNSNGYNRIGTPTADLGAPSKTFYHATSSQRLKMSKYISAPFLLEKVQVIFTEARAQRLQGDAPSPFSAAARNGANRDIDNYVFFAYHQRHLGSENDSLVGVSGSRRDLIFSGSMSFWNSASFYGSSESEAVLTHTPAFDHNFGLSYSTGLQVGQFTGSIGLEILPAVVGRRRSGLSLVPSSTISGILDQWLGSFWPGSTSFDNFEPKVRNVNFLANFSDFFGWSDSPSVDSFNPKLNARSVRAVGGESSTNVASLSLLQGLNSNSEQSSVSPYLLLPEDELIFGFDAGISPFRFSNSFSEITGSHFEIASKPCKVIFYGSLVKNSVEFLPSLNQDLSSNSVHEIVGAEPALDQFQIEPISSYFGSYLDEIVTGSMATPQGVISFSTASQDQSRRVISRVSLGQAGTTGSLQRFVKMSDANERTYDSCLPNALQFLGNAVTFLHSTETTDGAVFTSPYDVDAFESGSFYPNQFPFQDNPTRFVKPKDSALAANSPVALLALTPRWSTVPLVEDIVFRTGWLVRSLVPATISGHRHSSNTSAGKSQRQRSYGRAYRYGISSTTPEFSSSRWRSDHYGYFRDMLEPRQGVTTSNRTPPVKIMFMSGSSTTLADLTHSQNISNFATSSLPYFDDGVARNREDNPDDSLTV